MLTREAEYLQYKDIYQAIQAEQGSPDYAILVPSDERVYEINLNTRTIDSPDFVAVSSDHRAETIYFKTARYFDNVDLSQMTCVVQYINAKKERRVYAVPFVDVETFKGSDEIVFPWVIDKGVASSAGTVSYSIKFYKIGIEGQIKPGGDENSPYYEYELNTLPTTTKVLTSLSVTSNSLVDGDSEGKDYLIETADSILAALQAIQTGQKAFELHWLDLD